MLATSSPFAAVISQTLVVNVSGERAIHVNIIMINRQPGLERPGDLDLRLVHAVAHHERHINERRAHRRQWLGDVDVALRIQVEAVGAADKAGPGRQEPPLAVRGDGGLHSAG